MPRQLKVGVVGCGEVAQIIHLPAFRELPELFTVTALCDASPSVLAAVGAGYPEAGRFATVEALVAEADVDVVLIANPHVYHADTALAAMAAGKHVLIEKPMCITLGEADALLAAEEAASVTVQVGFMRRHAPAFVEAVERVAAVRGSVNLARVHDVIGANSTIIDSTSLVHRGEDIPDDMIAGARASFAAKVKEAVGAEDPALVTAYGLLLGLGSHDTSAMRELIGMPTGVLYAAQRSGGRMISAAFDYGTFVCQFETGVDRIARFDAYLEICTPEEIIRVDYDTPYIRHLPAELTVTRGREPAGISVERSYATRNDAFVAEWRSFHRCVETGEMPKTSIADARQDLVLYKDMMAVMS